ncbi:hypothetical protein CORC01_01929 [Colletotrichum orchidophilum]|uniref:Uncharacterized protein n=1 Tax=Colletotrichum orchidophilum TaxID=1209926 RepID=A0A1G4BND8_9PEZI|nr:uncharacterized protein CORC01_01929 [Colletotrichum orchidophilum]OHF02828.1 hypothetical protein CORC01_01929 [Colletotrichum orchidophilum]
MSRYFPHAAYAEDQPLAGTILTVHVLTRGYTTGAVMGLGAAAVGGVYSRVRGAKPLPAAAPFPTSTTTTLRTAGVHNLLRSSGTASAVGLGFAGVALLARMHGREDIELRDRAWRLMESRSQLETDDWTYGGAAAGLAALGIARAAAGQAVGLRVIAGAAGLGSVAALPVKIAQSKEISNCEICQRIWTRIEEAFTGDGSHAFINIDSFQEALSSKCSRHLPMVEMFHKRCNKPSPFPSRESNDVGIGFPRVGEIMRDRSNLDSFSSLICNYNQRSPTCDKDALPSISGLLNDISRYFWGGFLYGLTEMYFEAALSWEPYWSHTELRRRPPPPVLMRASSFHAIFHSGPGWDVKTSSPSDAMKQARRTRGVGVLRLYNKGSTSELSPARSCAKKVELVATCLRRNYKITFDKRIYGYTRPLTATEVYIVLWVE